MMFLQVTDPFKSNQAGLYTDVLVSNFANKVNQAFADSFNLNRIEDFFLTLEDKAVKLNTTLGQGLKSNVAAFEKTMYNVYQQGLEYGIAWDDSAKFLTGVQASMGKMIPVTADVTKNALIFGKAIGETPENVAKLIGGMTQYAVSQSKAVTIMNRVAAIAKSSGVDAKTLAATVSKDLYKTQLYGFKGGVEGLTKMAAQAQRIGFDLSKAQTVADKILEGGPEEAVKMASEIQALGGNIGSLGDPFQIMHMAMYDMEGLQDQIIKASASAVQFNETTGDFKIGGEEMLRLRQQAKALGLSYEDVARGAINARKEQEISSRVDLSQLTEDQRSLVASLAEIGPGGKVTLDVPGFGNITDLEATLKSNPGALATALDKYEKDSKLTDAQLQSQMLTNAKSQLSVQEEQLLTLQALQNQGIFGMGLTQGKRIVKEGAEDLTMYGRYEAEYKALKNKITTEYASANVTIADSYATFATGFGTLLTNLTNAVHTLVENVKLIMGNVVLPTPNPSPPPVASDAFIPANGGNLITGAFGSLLSDGKDQMLLSPNISDFFKKYNEAENNLKSIGSPQTGGDLSLLYKQASAKPSESLTDLLTKTGSFPGGVTQINQKVEIGGKTEVVIDIRTNIPQNLVNEVLNTSQLKETIMTTVNNRLSAEFSDKLSNALITQKRG